MDNPCTNWLSDNSWDNITELDKLTNFHGIITSFEQYARDWNPGQGGVIPIDCSAANQGFGGAANAVRNLWWYKDGFYNITGEWDPINTIYNAYNIDMIQFEVYVSPDEEETSAPIPAGAAGPAPQAMRWVKLISDKFINLDYIKMHR